MKVKRPRSSESDTNKLQSIQQVSSFEFRFPHLQNQGVELDDFWGH